jgi:HK97 family phage major capsid protein
LKRPYRKNASFLCNDQTLAVLRKLTDKNGRPIWQDSIQEGEPGRILGFKVHTSPYFPVIGAGVSAIAFGDFSYYWIIIRDEVTVKVLKELYYDDGQIGYIAREYLDAKLIRPEAIKVIQMT